MSELFGRHRTLPDGAAAASEACGICTPFPEVPSGKINGETARGDGHAACAVRLSPAPAPPNRTAPVRKSRRLRRATCRRPKAA